MKVFILEHVTDDIDWRIIGHEHIQGKAQFENVMANWPDNKIHELTLHSIITHGKEGAVSGTMLMANGKRYEFCDVYEFESSKGSRVKKMTSYIIIVKKQKTSNRNQSPR